MAWPHTFGNQTQANGSWLDDNFNAALQAGQDANVPSITSASSGLTISPDTATSILNGMVAVKYNSEIGNGLVLYDGKTAGGTAGAALLLSTNSAPTYIASFYVNNTTPVGTIGVTGTSTSYNTTSDAALKVVHGPSDGSPLSALPVRDCSFSSEGTSAAPHPMILAQECAAIAPWAVTQGREAVAEVKDAQGNVTIPAQPATPCMLDYSKLVAPLIAYAQALEARIGALEAKATVAAPAASARLVAARSALASAAALPVVQAAIARGVALKGASNGSPQAQTL